MAKKKQEEYEFSGSGSKTLAFFRFFTRTPVWQILLLAIAVGVAWWKWSVITSWYHENIFRPLGWGVVIALGLVITFAVLLKWKRSSLAFRYWYRWLSALLFLLFAWGILAYIPAQGIGTVQGAGNIPVGGIFGLQILGGTNSNLAVGSLRLAGILVLAVFFISPRVSLRIIGHLWVRFINQMKSPGNKRILDEDRYYPAGHGSDDNYLTSSDTPVKKQIARKSFPDDEGEQLPLKPEPAPEIVLSKPKEKSKAASTISKAFSRKKGSSQPADLKQVAQDVWKKYGESPDLVISEGWKLPPIEILDLSPEIHFNQADNEERARLIEDALSSYGVEAKVVQINAGPTVTQFGVEPGWVRRTREVKEKDKDGNTVVRQEEVSRTRVKVDRIASLQNDLALALSAPSIRIEAPVPGKGIVGIEVPNSVSTMVTLRGVIETGNFRKLQNKTKLSLALGQGAGGEAVVGDLAKMPHLLIAGATGSGKTVCLNTIICCLLLNNTPNDVRFIMIDPKRVELSTYKGIPHLAAQVIVEPDKAVEALRWLSREMDRRYQVMSDARSRNIDSYNKNRDASERMAYLVLVIDELADLMMTGGDEVETILCRLAQLSRAVGIHLIVATQRPSVDVITGLIKANFPTRISFAVTSQIDSRTVLDVTGAEKLLGNGDMLFLPTDASKPKRLQGCYVSDPEADRLVYFWSNQHRDEVIPLMKVDELALAAARHEHPEDKLMETARQLAREHDNISTSFLQRRLHIGYPRAARIMDQLEMELQEWEKEEVEDELEDLDDYEDFDDEEETY